MTTNIRLRDIVKKYGLVYAPPGEQFTLASGAKSDFYIDFSLVMMRPIGAAVITRSVLAAIKNVEFDSIGGPSSGADPIIGGLMVQLSTKDPPVCGFTIRKEPKGRGPGAGAMFEGHLKPGQKVIVVEDVTTSGGSILKAIKVVEDAGAKVVKAITLLDRLAGAKEKLNDYDFEALLTLDDVMQK